MKKKENITNNRFSAKDQLTFGIMCRGTKLAAWQAASLQKLLNLGYVKPALVIIEQDDQGSSGTFTLRKMRKLKPRNALWYLYSKLFVNPKSWAMRPVHLSRILTQVPSIRCKVMSKGNFSQYFSDQNVYQIREYNLDFILRFGFGTIRGEILNGARFGIWSFHYGDEQKFCGGPPGFWEIYRGDNITRVILQRLTDRLDEVIVLKKGLFKTVRTSYTRNRDTIYFESAYWPAQVCIDILSGNAHYLEASPTQTTAPIFHNPSNVQMLLFLAKVMVNILKGLYKTLLHYDEWGIGIVDKPVNMFLKPGARPKVQWLPAAPRGKFYADPFAIQQGDSLHLLFEEYDFRMSKGCISTTRISQTSTLKLKAVINEPFHMSYPYLFCHEGEIYCVPETSQAKQVRLYKAINFPEDWVLAGILIENVAAVDSTIFQHNRRWWLFATDNDGGNHFIFILKVWYADDLFGPWKPHANNPVKVDIRSARPAGTPFIHNGELYRPSQDNSDRYGHHIVINRIVCLTPTEFQEKQVGVIEPYKNSPYPDGLHTLCAAGGVTVIDGVRHRFIGKNLTMLMLNVKAILSHTRYQNATRGLQELVQTGFR